jgi:hypothetical protein
VTRRILGVVFFNFIAYLAVGLPIAVVPGFVHGDLGYSAVLAGWPSASSTWPRC